MENIIPPVIAGIFTLLAAWLSERWRRRQLGTNGVTARVSNQAAYEMAYRGILHDMAGRRRKCRRQTRTGKAWLREASYQHGPSSRAGQNDAIADVKAAVIASSMIDQEIRCDELFLENAISAKLQERIGNRPAAQVTQIRRDAMQSAALYQQIIQSQMRRLNMISSTVQFILGTSLFAVAALLLAMIPSSWAALNGLPPGVLASEWILQFKITYVVVSVGLLSGGIALLFARR